jgi:diadenosine tetraphosphate (Ap4A) HIT family hydrolase
MICDAGLIQVWENGLWRLTMGVAAPGFCYLEPKRHIPRIADLDGDEAATFGGVLAHMSQILQEETGAQLVSVSIPGGDATHLRVHLMPQVNLTEEELREVAERVRSRLAAGPPPRPEKPEQPPLLPFPVPQTPPRRWQPDWEPDPEIPPPRREPPDEGWPDRPAHDPWF